MFCNFAYFLHILRTNLIYLLFSMCKVFFKTIKRVSRKLLWIFLEETVHSDWENEDFFISVNFFNKLILV